MRGADQGLNNLVKEKQITPQERQKIFEGLDPANAVAFWEKSSNEERRLLALAMHQKYWEFVEAQVKKGLTIDTQNSDDKQMWERIFKANEQVMELGRRPAPRSLN
jgi:hypothetical protein